MPNISDMVAPEFNFTYWQQHLVEFFTQGYTQVVGFFFWPIVFMGFIGYIYTKQQSVVAASVGILIICAGFAGEGIFMEVPVVMLFFQLVFALAITGLFVMFYLKRRD